ncbi:hypothetical protein [Halopelagius fulvigenes]|uniref:DUF7974 domain-containing protein n=1 Tax=Halopelagius fulvigenes TaxID=1198324 RepID=A0ABD5TZ73_9EURY
MPPSNGATDRQDRYGFDDTSSPIAAALGKFVPQSVARRSLSVTVETDREVYAPGDPVELTVVIENSLPLPVAVETETRRLWGWTVDGELEASDERVYLSDAAGTLSFRAKERKVLTHTWDGRFKRVGGEGEPTRWVEAEPGVHEIGAFVDVPEKPEDSVEIRIEK